MIKAPLSSKLQRFRARITALIARKLGLKFDRTPASTPSAPVQPEPDAAPAQIPIPIPLPAPAPAAPPITVAPEAVVDAKLPPAERNNAQTFEGSARSSAGATSPWLLLPPERAYRLYVPAHAADGEPLPLVVMIHGCRESAAEFEQGTGMNAIADRGGFAVLYPDQATFANIRRCWNWFEPNTAAGNGECAIILEMIKSANQHVTLDRARVYVAGMSSGGALAALLAYHHPDVFAAVAVHSGLPPMMPASAAAAISAMNKGVRVDPEAIADSYWNTHEVPPPPLIILHGNADETVTDRNATGLMNVWEKLFETAPQASQLAREEREFESTELARAYSQIDLQREGQMVLRSLSIDGLAHAWSGGDAALPFNDAKGPDASAAIWTFFERHRR